MNTIVNGALTLLFPQRLCCHGCGCMLAAGEGVLCQPCREVLQACMLKRKDAEALFKPEAAAQRRRHTRMMARRRS